MTVGFFVVGGVVTAAAIYYGPALAASITALANGTATAAIKATIQEALAAGTATVVTYGSYAINYSGALSPA